MTPERWQQIESVLRQAEGLDESGRRALLDTFAPSDPDLVQEVETLLEADGEAGQFLEDLAAQGAHQLLESLDLPPETAESEDPIAPEIGAYRILRSLGRGGMGTVYLAERADRSFKKAVAINKG